MPHGESHAGAVPSAMIGSMSTAEATREVVLRLPESLARDAECAGLLTSASLAHLLDIEIRMRELREITDAFDALGPEINPRMTDDEVVAEVKAARAEMYATTVPGRS